MSHTECFLLSFIVLLFYPFVSSHPSSNHKHTKTISLRTPACERQNSSYRSTFTITPGGWTTVRLPFSDFEGYGAGPDTKQFEPSVRRLAVVSIGEAKDVVLAVAKVGFYNVF